MPDTLASRPRKTMWTGHRIKRHGEGTWYWCSACEGMHRGRAHVEGFEACPRAEAPVTLDAPAIVDAAHLGSMRKDRPKVRVNLGGP